MKYILFSRFQVKISQLVAAIPAMRRKEVNSSI